MNDITDFLNKIRKWGENEENILAIGLVGSYARDSAKEGSDVDLMILCKDPKSYISNEDWIEKFGNPKEISNEVWNQLKTKRVFYENGLEVEFNFDKESWANPENSGTKRVVEGSMRILIDKAHILSGLLNALSEVQILDSVPNDVFDIQKVIRETWIDTYPNEKLGISREDLIERFKEDDTEEGKKRIESHKSRYSDPKYHTWVAKSDNEIIGVCIAGKESNNHRIFAIYILPGLQHQGIGRKFMEKALEWIGDKEDIHVNVASYNESAIKFYKNFGFTKSHRKVKETARPLPNGSVIPEIELVKTN